MTPDPALTADEQAALNGGKHVIRRYLSVYQPTAVYTSTVDTAPAVWPIYLIDGSDILPTTVKRGMTMIISRSGVTIGIYRVVADGKGNSTAIGVAPLAEQDAGLLNIAYRTSSIESGDDINIYNRWDLWAAYPDYVSIPGAWREDGYDYAGWVSEWTTGNAYPAVVVNLGKHRSQFVDTGQTYATLTFTCEVLVWHAGAVTLAWDIPGTWTVTAGNATTASFTARVPAGFYVLSMTVTHDTDKTTVARRMVWVHDTGSNAPIPLVDIPSDERNRTGRQMVLGLNNDALSDIPAGSMVNYFEVCTWNGTSVPTATTNFTGWITRESKRINRGLRRADVGILGPADLLKLIPAYSQYLAYDATPATFQEVYYTGVQYIIFDLLWKRAANILSLFDMHFLHDASTPPGIYYNYNTMPAWAIDQAGNLLEQIQGLARNVRLNYGHSSTGAMYLMPHPNETVPEVAGVYARSTVVRDRLTTNRYAHPLNFERVPKPEYRRTRVSAFCYAAGTTVTPLIGEAPWGALGQGSQEDLINGYITNTNVLVNAQTEVNTLAGQIQAAHNNPLPDVPFTIPDNRDVYEPAQMSFVASDVPSTDDPDGAGWSNANGVPISVTKNHRLNGTASLTLHLEMETGGIDGGTVTVT